MDVEEQGGAALARRWRSGEVWLWDGAGRRRCWGWRWVEEGLEAALV
jgi:hypothetical protein